MPRRRVSEKREILSDPMHDSILIAKLINRVMESGKKAVAEKIVYGALDKVQERVSKSKTHQAEGNEEGGESHGSHRPKTVVDLLEAALDNVRPIVEVRARRVGGSTYQIPTEVRSDRRDALAMRWVIESAQKRGEKSMVLKLAGELFDALEGRGAAVKKRETVHAMAKANQAFAHFAR
jgi:small subunit ribosomal protein S7